MRILSILMLVLLPVSAMAAQPPASGEYARLVRELLRNCGGDRKIAVADFSYPDGRSSWDGEVVSERVTAEIVRLRKFRVAERKEMQKVLAELKLQSSGATGSDPIKDLGKLLGADWLVLGTLTGLSEGRIEINARLVGVESGEIVNAAAARIRKDWRERPEAGDAGEHEFSKNDELDEYGKAIRKYMDRKAGEDRHVLKDPPPSFK